MLLSSLGRHPLRSFPRIRHVQRQQAPTRSFITNILAPAQPEKAPKLAPPGIKNQVLFFICGSALIYGLSAGDTNIETQLWAKRLSSKWSTITNTDLRRLQQVEFVKDLRNTFSRMQKTTSELPALMQRLIIGSWLSLAQPYADAPEGRRMCWKICLFNLGIWGLWQFRRLQPIMTRNFAHNPLSGLSFTLVTSIFSHKSFLHLLFNCMALESFGSAASTWLTTSQAQTSPEMLELSPKHHFFAFFITAGAFSSLVSHIVTAKFKYPAMVRKLASAPRKPQTTDTWAAAVASTAQPAATVTKETVPKIMPSLGASGAVYSCVVVTALAYPHSQVAMAIPPSYPINIGTAVPLMVGLDLIGALRGWRLFDHWAHLGGAAFGWTYFHYGPTVWSALRASMMPKKVAET